MIGKILGRIMDTIELRCGVERSRVKRGEVLEAWSTSISGEYPPISFCFV